jgi:hypothetical protein
MNRSLVALVLALATTACGDSDDPPGAVTAYWGFVRNTAEGVKLLDATDFDDPSVQGACAESGVEYVRLTALDGRDVDPGLLFEGLPAGAIPCVVDGVHGVTFRAIPSGTHTWNVTGYRTFRAQDGTIRDIPVAQSSTQFDVRPDRLSTVEVPVQPIQDDVQFIPVLYDATNAREVTCEVAGVREIDVFVTTPFAGEPLAGGGFRPFVVFDGTVPCGPTTLRLDRDDYDLRMRGFPTSGNVPPTHDTNITPFCDRVVAVEQLGPAGFTTSWAIDMFSVGAVLCP